MKCQDCGCKKFTVLTQVELIVSEEGVEFPSISEVVHDLNDSLDYSCFDCGELWDGETE
jgi:hypothetical protein